MNRQSIDTLSVRLLSLDGKGYGAYKSLVGAYGDDDSLLMVDRVQGDPFAEPSRVRLWLSPRLSRLPHWSCRSVDRRRATADWLNRRLWAACERHGGDYGSGKSGRVEVLKPSQAVLMRTSLRVFEDGAVEARIRVGLPAFGRRIAGRNAQRLLVDDLPQLAKETLQIGEADCGDLMSHVNVVEDAVALRQQLHDRGLIAFVPDGASLPRRSGVDDRPLQNSVVLFESPASLRVELNRPNGGVISGMGIPKGVTLIVGGGYHGKSTLLRAIENGVYDHVPGDGREAVVTVSDAMKIRAEDGRAVTGVDISAFIGCLPQGSDTGSFSTENASGSTSQAAAISESLEAGTKTLLIDEDTSATNFMIRDARMQRLVASEHEPITPFIDRVRQLFESESVSTVAVVGGAGDYFEVADRVVRLTAYRAEDVTIEAKQIAHVLPSGRDQVDSRWSSPMTRVLELSSLRAESRGRSKSIKRSRLDRVQFGDHEVELSAVEQIVESAQTRAMAEVAAWMGQGEAKAVTWGELTQILRERLGLFDAEEWALDALGPRPGGDFASFRALELSALINRLRTLRASTASGDEGT